MAASLATLTPAFARTGLSMFLANFQAQAREFFFHTAMITRKEAYAQKLKDPRWQKKRLCVMERDGWKCRDCGDNTSPLHVHHCYYAKGDPWNTPDDFLLTTCEKCHETRQSFEDQVKRSLGLIFARTKNNPENDDLAWMAWEFSEIVKTGNPLQLTQFEAF